MADEGDVIIERVEPRSVVLLTVSRASIDAACRRLPLAAALRFNDAAPISLWIAPDRWLLVCDDKTPGELIVQWEAALDGLVHNIVDQSAAYAIFRISGSSVRKVLAAGCGVDLRPSRFSTGVCCRTRLAQISVVLVARDTEVIECYVERSLSAYFDSWLRDSAPSGDLHSRYAPQ